MWIAQWPGGTWCAYQDKPALKMSGWDGKIYAYLMIQNNTLSWRETLREYSFKEYQDKFRTKELR